MTYWGGSHRYKAGIEKALIETSIGLIVCRVRVQFAVTALHFVPIGLAYLVTDSVSTGLLDTTQTFHSLLTYSISIGLRRELYH